MHLLIAILLVGQVVVTPDDLNAFAKALFGAAEAHQWHALVGFVLIAVSFVLRKYASLLFPPKVEAWLKSDVGGIVLTMFVAITMTYGTALVSGVKLTAGLAWGSVVLTAGAGGVYGLVRKLLSANGGLGAKIPVLDKVSKLLSVEPVAPAPAPDAATKDDTPTKGP